MNTERREGFSSSQVNPNENMEEGRRAAQDRDRQMFNETRISEDSMQINREDTRGADFDIDDAELNLILEESERLSLGSANDLNIQTERIRVADNVFVNRAQYDSMEYNRMIYDHIPKYPNFVQTHESFDELNRGLPLISLFDINSSRVIVKLRSFVRVLHSDGLYYLVDCENQVEIRRPDTQTIYQSFNEMIREAMHRQLMDFMKEAYNIMHLTTIYPDMRISNPNGSSRPLHILDYDQRSESEVLVQMQSDRRPF